VIVIGSDGVSAHDLNDTVVVHKLAVRFSSVSVVRFDVRIATDLSSDVTGVGVDDGDNLARLFVDVIVDLRNPWALVFVVIVVMVIIMVVFIVMVISIVALNDVLNVASVWVLDRDNFASLFSTMVVFIVMVISIVALNDVLNVASVWVLDRDNFASLFSTMVVVISVVVVSVIRGALNNLVNDDSVLDDVGHSADGLVIMGVIGDDGVLAMQLNDAVVVHNLAVRFSSVRVVRLYVVIAVDLSSDVTSVRVNDGNNLASLLVDVRVSVWVVMAGVSVQMINDFVVMVRVGGVGMLS